MTSFEPAKKRTKSKGWMFYHRYNSNEFWILYLGCDFSSSSFTTYIWTLDGARGRDTSLLADSPFPRKFPAITDQTTDRTTKEQDEIKNPAIRASVSLEEGDANGDEEDLKIPGSRCHLPGAEHGCASVNCQPGQFDEITDQRSSLFRLEANGRWTVHEQKN